MITFGSDPEFMLKDKKGNLKSAIEVVPGKKEDRFDLGNGHACYYDNVLAECSLRPGKNADDAIESFKEGFTRFAQLVAPYQLVPQASATYPEHECEHKEAKRFGCDPEFCAYEVQMVEPPVCEGSFRSGGGHVHIGYDGGADIEDDEANYQIAWNRLWVARMADLFLGVPSLVLDQDITSKERRKLYGGAGTHRVCLGYGVEYRSLSNFWLSRPSLVKLVHDLCCLCVKCVLDDGVHEHIWNNEIQPEQLRKTINNWDLKAVDKLLSVAHKYIPKKLQQDIEREQKKGHSENFYKQWGINV